MQFYIRLPGTSRQLLNLMKIFLKILFKLSRLNFSRTEDARRGPSVASAATAKKTLAP